MPTNYSRISSSLINVGTFIDSNYLGSFSNGAYYLILIGTVATALAFVTYVFTPDSTHKDEFNDAQTDTHRGLLKHTLLFLLSTGFAIIGTVTLLIGATIWTVIVKKSESINDFVVGQADSPAPLGIVVSTGDAIFLLWASWACILVSILPYMIRRVDLRVSKWPHTDVHCTVAVPIADNARKDAGHR